MRALTRTHNKQRQCGGLWSMLITVVVVVVWSNLVAVCNKSTSGGTTKEHAKHLRRISPGFPCLCFQRASARSCLILVGVSLGSISVQASSELVVDCNKQSIFVGTRRVFPVSAFPERRPLSVCHRTAGETHNFDLQS